jgi:hypothetical protein
MQKSIAVYISKFAIEGVSGGWKIRKMHPHGF